MKMLYNCYRKLKCPSIEFKRKFFACFVISIVSSPWHFNNRRFRRYINYVILSCGRHFEPGNSMTIMRPLITSRMKIISHHISQRIWLSIRKNKRFCINCFSNLRKNHVLYVNFSVKLVNSSWGADPGST